MLVTEKVFSKNLNPGKYAQLVLIARYLGDIRKEVWQRYGSIAGVERSFYDIRDEWMKSGRKFSVPARLWKATLAVTLGEIKMYREAAKAKVRKCIINRTKQLAKDNGWDEEKLESEQKKLFITLKHDKWMTDPYLRRMMRKHYQHGHTSADNQIVLDGGGGSFKWFEKDCQGWIEVMSLIPRHRIAIPLSSNKPVEKHVKLILHNGMVEVHHSVDLVCAKPCGTKEVGVDKGYTEAFTDNDGDKYGEGLGKLLSEKTDHDTLKYQRRNKIKNVADKADPAKKIRIIKNNLGRKKLDEKKRVHRENVKNVVYKAVHKLVDKADRIVAEDLTWTTPRRKKKSKKSKQPQQKQKRPMSKKQTNRLNKWTKGLLARALNSVSLRRGSTVALVNCAYTSQTHAHCGCLGTRDGDVFYCEVCRVYANSHHEAAKVILSRLTDHEIGRWDSHQKVRAVLEERTRRYRLGLLNQDSSCATKVVVNGERNAGP